jgi:hypothetical protein
MFYYIVGPVVLILWMLVIDIDMDIRNVVSICHRNRNEYQEFPGGKGRPACGADNLTAICEPIV